MANTNALAIREQTTAIEPSSMGELVELARMAARSNFFGTSPEQALMIAMIGRDIGFSYSQAMRAFYVVKGKATLSADGMVAAALASGECEYFRAVEVTDESATWETKRRGSQPRRYTFTMADAKRAGIANDMYQKHPKRMLSARAKSYLARDEYPDVLLGLVTDDEAQEIAASRPAPAASPVAYVVDEPAPIVAPPPPATPDWQALATEAASLLHRAETLAELDAAQARLGKLAPKGSPYRGEIAKLLEARRAELTRPAQATAEHDAEPPYGGDQ